MPLFKKKPYSRTETLAAADTARGKGKWKKALAGYKKVLEHDPDDAGVHAKIAPLYAKARQREAALKSFEAAAQGQIKKGFTDRAVAVYTQATTTYPDEMRLWEAIAVLHIQRARNPDAVGVLVSGARALAKANKRPDAVLLLRRATGLDPLHVEGTLLLARLLAKQKQKQEAKRLLADLADHSGGRTLRRVRAAQLRLSPTPAALWRWLVAAIRARR